MTTSHVRRLASAVPMLALVLAVACTGDALRGDLYVASGFTDEVLHFDASSGVLIDRLSFDRRRAETDEPHALAVSPDRRFLYVTVAHGDPTLWKLSLPDNQVVGRVSLGLAGAGRIGLTPDGATAFVPDYYRSGGAQAGDVAIVRLYDLAVLDRRTLCVAPHDAQVAPDGSKVAIVCSKSDEIVVLDAGTLAERARFPVAEAVGPPGEPRHQPLNAVWSPDGDRLFVTLHRADRVAVFDQEGGRLRSVAVGAGPAQIAISPDGTTLVTANRRDDSVSIIDAGSLTERARIPTPGAHPHGVALSRDGRVAFVTFEGSTRSAGGVLALDVETGGERWVAEAGAYTLGVVFVPRARQRR